MRVEQSRLCETKDCKLLGFFDAAQVDSALLARQCMEYAFDVYAVSDMDSDEPASKNKREAFEALRTLYNALGRRFKNLVIVDGFVDWFSQGHFMVRDVKCGGVRTVEVTEKITGKIATVPADMIMNVAETLTSKDVKHNYCMARAVLNLKSIGVELPLFSLFPKVRPSLVMIVSDELGATQFCRGCDDDDYADSDDDAGSDDDEGPPAKKKKTADGGEGVATGLGGGAASSAAS